jgi:hypothetical protein
MTRAVLFAALTSVLLATSVVTTRTTTAETRWGYLTVTPGVSARPGDAAPSGYRACQATLERWSCREFRSAPAADNNDVLAKVLTTLGDEGWELTSVLDETKQLSQPRGLTYIFKRQQLK